MQMEELYFTIINGLSDGVYFADLDRRILLWNKTAEVITGYTTGEIIGKACPDTLLNHIDAQGTPLCEVGCPLFSTIVDGKQRRAQVFVRHKEGYRIPIMVHIFPVVQAGEIIGAAEVFTRGCSTTYEDNLIERLTEIAMHDALTGLPNRRYLESFLQYRLDMYNRFQRPFALLYADIDNFNCYNNDYGHEAGDLVLMRVAEGIRDHNGRNHLVGRWGGDEFIGIYSIASAEDIPILAEQFRGMISETAVMYHSNALRISVSVGVTAVKPGDTAASIVERADRLMYRDKKKGKNCHSVG